MNETAETLFETIDINLFVRIVQLNFMTCTPINTKNSNLLNDKGEIDSANPLSPNELANIMVLAEYLHDLLPNPAGDNDWDQDVNLFDFVSFQQCYSLTEPSGSCDALEFATCDMNDDNVINSLDYDCSMQPLIINYKLKMGDKFITF